MPKTPYEIDQILDDLRNNYIRTDRDRMIRDEIDRLLRRNADGELVPVPAMFSGGKEARGIVLTGWPGEGKSTTMQQVLSTHPALGPSPDGPARYLSVKVPSPAMNRPGFAGDQLVRVTRPYRVCSSLHRRPPLLRRVGCFQWAQAGGGC
ncbi:MAG: ATP-binding protein, partial [Rhodobacteraceae bacterium]|nr:ATP-binding protein [Paracoccaceae bacterium]MCF8515906.1 ATP-binding protein [Paracoccaceae bacterium]MCF8520326.1 ATP-binding protein [Paracoccaceae bacterium]